jgi:hypothetical protein
MSEAGFSEDPTDQANRFAIVIVALLAIFGAVLVALLAWGAPDRSIGWVADLAGYLRDHDNREAKLIITLGAAVIVLLLLTVIILEVTPSPIARMRLRDVRSGAGTITTVEIARRVEEEVRDVPHVRECTATVATRGGRRIDMVLDLHVDGGADLAAAADAACTRAQALVEGQMGIRLAERPRARIHYRELRLREPDTVPSSMRGAPSAGAGDWERPAAGDAGAEDDEGPDGRTRDAEPPEEAQA